MAANTAKGAILVTGANGGLGSAMVEQITSKPEFSAYHGLYTVRDKGTAHALTSILSSAGSTHAYDILSLDLTKLDNVRSVAEQVNVSNTYIEVRDPFVANLLASSQTSSSLTLKAHYRHVFLQAKSRRSAL